MTGGSRNYIDRGAVPRALEYIFRQESFRISSMRVCVSYMEIYSERAFDLLSQQIPSGSGESLCSVFPKEDESGELRMVGLSKHAVLTEQDALDLLFLGDANRIVAETTLNDSSTRSHCIFSITVECDVAESGFVRKGVLYLVDLAGSERLKNSTAGSQLFSESRNINLSLHFLEQVVKALQDKANGQRTHIPYRNCLLTTVLREALGGNCKTSMISTISLDDRFIDETISTCRFSQRVASIEVQAGVNEVMDNETLIRNLRCKISELRQEVALLRSPQGGEGNEAPSLTDEESEALKTRIQQYLESPDEVAFECASLVSVCRLQLCSIAYRFELRLEYSESCIGREKHGKRYHTYVFLSLSCQTGSVNIVSSSAEADETGEAYEYSRETLAEFASSLQTAFNEFKRLNPDLCQVSELDKNELKRLCEEGKRLGAVAAKARDNIESLKTDYHQDNIVRTEEALETLQTEKKVYSDSLTSLKIVKAEIYGIQKRIELKKRLAQDKFNAWYRRLSEHT